MPAGTYELVQSADGYLARIHARGAAVLATPRINRGTAFSFEERRELGLTGLSPTGVSTLDQQVRRTYAQYRSQPNDLAKWVYLANLRDRNEVLFHRLLSEHIEEMLPVVYTPSWAPRTSTCWWPPTPRASSGSATRGWAGSRSRSGSWRSTPSSSTPT